MAILKVKSNFGGDIRRFEVDRTWDALKSSVIEKYGVDAASLVITYVDEDGDNVRITNDEEFREAVRPVEGSGILRLNVAGAGQASPVAPSAPAAKPAAPAPAPAAGSGPKGPKHAPPAGPGPMAGPAAGPGPKPAGPAGPGPKQGPGAGPKGPKRGSGHCGKGSRRGPGADWEGVPPFFQFFAGLPNDSFMNFFPGGMHMRPIFQSMNQSSDEVKAKFESAIKAIFQNGDVEKMIAAMPEVVELVKTFADANLASEESVKSPIAANVLGNFVTELKALLSKHVSEATASEVTEAVRLGLSEETGRTLLHTALKRYRWVIYGEAQKLKDKPWEKEPGYAGEVVPTPPLQKGDTGAKVLHLQDCLIKVGKMSPENIRWRAGIFGPRTAQGVKGVQDEAKLQFVTKGTYGESTAEALKKMVEAKGDEDTATTGEAAAEPDFDIGSIFWLLKGLTPFLGGYHTGPAVRQQRPGPWMGGGFGMPFGPHMMHKVNKMVESASEQTRTAVHEAAMSVWSNGQMPGVFKSGPEVFPLLKDFVMANLEEGRDPEEPLDQAKVAEIKEAIAGKLKGNGVADETVTKIVGALGMALNEPSVRSFLQAKATGAKAQLDKVKAKFDAKPWLEEDGYADTAVPAAPIVKGDSGPQVMHLQSVLVELGKMDYSQMRFRVGFYGRRTTDAIAKIQEECGLKDQVDAVGSYDAVTLATVESLLAAKLAETTATSQ